jgi:hypothetical protein
VPRDSREVYYHKQLSKQREINLSNINKFNLARLKLLDSKLALTLQNIHITSFSCHELQKLKEIH